MRYVTVMGFAFTIVSVAISVPIYVPADYATIQEAIDAAGNGDIVILADGKYTGSGNRDIEFRGKAITVRSENGPDNCIIDCEGSEAERHRGFLFVAGEDANSLLEGFTITGGYPAGPSIGGAILCDGSEQPQCCPVIRNCVITGNTTIAGGGGIACLQASPWIDQCVISKNAAIQQIGGGIRLDGPCEVKITNCRLILNIVNDTYGAAGAIGCIGQISGIISGCEIRDNVAGVGGGIYSEPGALARIERCIIENNFARSAQTQAAGGIHRWDGPIVNCVIADNRGSEGVLRNCFGPILNCTIVHNYCATPDHGVLTGCVNSIRNCIIWENNTDALHACAEPEYCCWSLASGEEGDSNIKADPLFAPGSSYHLLSGSSCIDAGTNTTSDPLPDQDIDGGDRILDGNGDGAVLVDIGANEFIPDTGGLLVTGGNLEFVGTLELGEPEGKKISVSRYGDSSLNWHVDTGGCSWVRIEPASGILDEGIDEVFVYVDPQAAGKGDHMCELTISAEGALHSPHMVPVSLHVGDVHILEPGPASAIQAVINQASDYDTIVLQPGRYMGTIRFMGKAVTVRSIDPTNWDIVRGTIIDASYQDSCVIFQGEGPMSILDGITLTHGIGQHVQIWMGMIWGWWMYDDAGRAGGGIFCSGSPTIQRCVIACNGLSQWSDPVTRFGGGIAVLGGTPAIRNCFITDNGASRWGGGIFWRSDGRGSLVNCTIANNRVWDQPLPHQAYQVDCWSSPVRIANTVISGNDLSLLMVDPRLVTHCCLEVGYQLQVGMPYPHPSNGIFPYDFTRSGGNFISEVSFIHPWQGELPMQGDPDYPQTDFGDYHLPADSICYDMGSTELIDAGQWDIDGQKRVMGAGVDIGADEIQPSIRVSQPSGGEVWAAGSSHKIRWHRTQARRTILTNGSFEQPPVGQDGSIDPQILEIVGWQKGQRGAQLRLTMESFVEHPWSTGGQAVRPIPPTSGEPGLYQELVSKYQPHTRYTLRLLAGNDRNGTAQEWQVRLTAGGKANPVAQTDHLVGGIAAPGYWLEVMLIHTTGAANSDPIVGQPIGIFLNGIGTWFDRVELEAEELIASKHVTIEFSDDDDSSWSVIATDAPDFGSYTMSLPDDIQSDRCRIRVAASDGPQDMISIPSRVFTVQSYEAGEPLQSIWPTLGGGMQRRGLSDVSGPRLGCVKWSFVTDGPAVTGVAVGTENRVYLACEGGTLFALDNEGQNLWSFNLLHNSPGRIVEAQWLLNEGSGLTAYDKENSRNATLYGFAEDDSQWLTDATFGQVLQFDGIDDYVEADTYRGIEGTSPRRVSAWIKTTASGGDIVFWGSNTESGRKWRIRVFDIGDGNGVLRSEINGSYVFGNTPINTGQWVHIEVILPSSKSQSHDVRLFVNGVMESVDTVTYSPESLLVNTKQEELVCIGGSPVTGGYFTGQIADMQIERLASTGSIVGTPSIGADGTVYIGAANGRLYAVDQEGELRWTHDTQGFIVSSPAITSNQKVFFGSSDGNVIALAADGSELWKFAVPGPGRVGGAVLTSPAIGRDGSVYIGGMYNSRLYALDPNDGSVRWESVLDSANRKSMVNAPVVAEDGTIYVTLTNDPKLYSIEPADGSVNWAKDLSHVPQLLAYWKFDGGESTGMLDSSTYNHMLSPLQTVEPVWIKGYFGNALSSPPMTVYRFSWDKDVSSRTIMAWIKPGAPNGIIRWEPVTNSGETFDMRIGNGPSVSSESAILYVNYNGQFVISGGPVLWGQPWHHVAVVLEANEINRILTGCRLYVDGHEVQSQNGLFIPMPLCIDPQSPDSPNPTSQMILGRVEGLDEVRLYRAVLSGDQIRAIMQERQEPIWHELSSTPSDLSKEHYCWTEPVLGPDGTVYISFDDGCVRAVDASGDIKWITCLGGPGSYSLSMGADGLLYAAGEDGRLVVLEENGAQVATFDAGWATENPIPDSLIQPGQADLSMPVIGKEGTVYVSDFHNRLWALSSLDCGQKDAELAFEAFRRANVSGDMHINLNDLAVLAADWLQCTGDGPPCTESPWSYTVLSQPWAHVEGDLNMDAYVDLSDLAAMADLWLFQY